MNYIKILIGALLAGVQAHADKQTVAVKDLNLIGLNSSNIIEEFRNKTGVNLNPDEILRVTEDEEGKNLHLETFDKHSVRIDILKSKGSFNKISL